MKTTRHEEIMEYIGHDPDSVADAIVNLERRNARLRAVLAEYEDALADGPENLSYARYEEISEKAKLILSNSQDHPPEVG